MNRRGAEAAEQKTFTEPRAEANEVTRAVIGAAIEVHRHLGPGFLESVYEQAFAAELAIRCIEFERQVPFEIRYKGDLVGLQRVDFIVGHEVVVELKATESLSAIHRAQVMSYLKASSYHLGLLINFNVYILTDGVRRIVWSP